MKKRNAFNEEVRKLNEAGMIKIRQQISVHKLGKAQCDKLVDIMMKKMPKLKREFEASIEAENIDEFQRRLTVLTRPFISKYINFVQTFFQLLECPSSSDVLLSHVMTALAVRITIRPDIDAANCVLVQQRIAELIAYKITDIKNVHKKRIITEAKLRTGILCIDEIKKPPESDKENLETMDQKPNVRFFAEADSSDDDQQEKEFRRKRAQFVARKIDKTVG